MGILRDKNIDFNYKTLRKKYKVDHCFEYKKKKKYLNSNFLRFLK